MNRVLLLQVETQSTLTISFLPRASDIFGVRVMCGIAAFLRVVVLFSPSHR